MDATLLGLIGIGVMLGAILLLNVTPGFAMALVGFLGIAALRTPSLGGTLANTAVGAEFWALFSNYGLTVIPLFILLGEVVHYAGYSEDLFRAAERWFGHRRGGLAVTTVLASAGFAAICGSNTATAATMSAVAIPPMQRAGYHPALKAGAVAAGSTLGVVIPPSLVLVVYGLHTGQSIGKLFAGSLVPSVLLVLGFVATVLILCRRHPEWGPGGAASTWREKFAALPKALDVAVLFTVVMAAMFSGKVTPTEAAGVSALLGLGVCILRRRLTWRLFTMALRDTLRISCMVFMIMAGAVIFGRFLTLTRLPFVVAETIGGLDLPGPLILMAMLGVYILGGCVMDSLAFLLVSLPIFMPLVTRLGYDPIWFGQVVCLVTTLGAITPPVGVCCFVVAGTARDVSVATAFRGALYYLPAYLLAVAALLIWPEGTVLRLASLVR